MAGDKRRFPRIRNLSFVAEKGQIFRTLDLSREGMMVEMNPPAPVGAQVQLDLALGEEVVEVRGEVMRHVPQGNGLVGVGIRFGRLSPKAERTIRDYLLRTAK